MVVNDGLFYLLHFVLAVTSIYMKKKGFLAETSDSLVRNPGCRPVGLRNLPVYGT